MEKSPLNISGFAAELRQGRLTPVWDFLKRLLVLPHPQKETRHYFYWNLWCGKPTAHGHCLNWAASVLRNLLCTLIPPTSSLNTCLWVMSRLGSHPKPAFTLHLSLSLPLSLRLSLSMEDFHQAPILCVGSTCNTGSSFRCEAARRLHCKRITRGQRKCSLQAVGGGGAEPMEWLAGLQSTFMVMSHGVSSQSQAAQSRRRPASHTHTLSYLVITLRWRWNIGGVRSDKQRRRYAYLMGCIIDCLAPRESSALCAEHQRCKNKTWSEKVIKAVF